MQTLIEVLDSQAAQIDEAKLKAIGMKNKVEGEGDVRRRRMQQMKAMVALKQQELERHQTYYNSLEKTEREQKQLIEKLSNNEV